MPNFCRYLNICSFWCFCRFVSFFAFISAAGNCSWPSLTHCRQSKVGQPGCELKCVAIGDNICDNLSKFCFQVILQWLQHRIESIFWEKKIAESDGRWTDTYKKLWVSDFIRGSGCHLRKACKRLCTPNKHLFKHRQNFALHTGRRSRLVLDVLP